MADADVLIRPCRSCNMMCLKNGSVPGNLRICPDELEHESLCFRAGLEQDVETWMRSKRALLMTHPLQLLISSESNPASSLPAFQLFLSDRGHEKNCRGRSHMPSKTAWKMPTVPFSYFHPRCLGGCGTVASAVTRQPKPPIIF